MAIKIGVINQKGGVGKTTTTHSLAAALSEQYDVLAVDLDAQGSLTDGLGIDPNALPAGCMEMLLGRYTAEHVLIKTPKFDLIPSNLELSAADLHLAGRTKREYLLQRVLKPIEKNYDFVILDCPPHLGLVTINALAYADLLLIPAKADYYSLAALRLITRTLTAVIEDDLNPDLRVLGILPTEYLRTKTLCRDVLKDWRQEYGDLVLDTKIRPNVKLAEAPSAAQDIFDYAPFSHGAEDYAQLCREVLSRIEKIQP